MVAMAQFGFPIVFVRIFQNMRIFARNYDIHRKTSQPLARRIGKV